MKKKLKFHESHIKLALKLQETHNITGIAKKFKYEDFPLYFEAFSVEHIRRSLSKKLAKLNPKPTPEEISEDYKKASKRKLSKSDFYIITWQQNNVPVNTKVWNSILKMKEHFNAELSVILGTYVNNESSFKNFSKDEGKWDRVTQEYWDSARHSIKGKFMVMSDVNIIPTAKYPLQSLQGLANGESMVFGHPKLHLKLEPTLGHDNHQILLTTGALTYPSYTYTKIGKEAENKHKYGCVLLEVSNGEIYPHQIEISPKGEFYFLKWKGTPEGFYEHGENLPAIVFGDTHIRYLDKKIEKENWRLLKEFSPKNIVFHDLTDGQTVNNHLKSKPLEKALFYNEGKYKIEDEIDETVNFLEPYLPYNPVVVQANHNNRFDRILNEDWRNDPVNAKYYLKYSYKILNNTISRDIGVIGHEIKEKYGDKVNVLAIGESFKVKGVELSQHGDKGVSGTRGSFKSFHRLNIKIILAHLHSSVRMDDTIFVGTNTILPLPYAKEGLSRSNQSNALIYPDGKMGLLLFLNGKFTNLL